jgi:hypothetical protein
MPPIVFSILFGFAAASLLFLTIVRRQWLGQRLPLVFLCVVVALLCLVRPAQLTDTFVAMIDARQYAGLAAGFFILALIPFILAMARLDMGGPSIPDTIVCLLPAIGLAGLGIICAPQSAYLSVPAILVGWAAGRWLPLAVPGLTRSKNALLGCLGFFYLVITVSVAISPIRLPIALGPLVITALGLMLFAFLLAVIQQFPKSALGFFLLWLSVASFDKRFATIPVEGAQARRDTQQALEAWLAARQDAVNRYRDQKRPLPVVIMSAEGGGIYAAAHSYLGYRALAHYCPQLKEHVFATIGVSGGALGFVMERALSRSLTSTQCRDDRAPNDVPDIVVADLLSPVLANLLLRQPIAWLMPFWNTLPDGGSALAETLSQALGSARDSPTNKATDAALVFVTTDARTGSRLVFSPIGFDGAGDVRTFAIIDTQSEATIRNMIIHAAVTSARFPFLTQSAVLNDGAVRRVLVDGGYSDNTGALTARNLITALRNTQTLSWRKDGCNDLTIVFAENFTTEADWSNCQLPLFLAHVAFAADPTVDASRQADPTIADPLLALLGARSREAQRALLDLEERQRNPDLDATGHVDNGFYAHRIAQAELALPLGWRLSATRASALVSDIAVLDLCKRETYPDGTQWAAAESTTSVLPRQERAARQEAIRRRTGCSMRVLMRLFDPEYRVSIVGFN